uniref:Uncharacterized protein n=1 Tax=Rhizophora mucronata TaxID=61149 RepID=A0A2P2NBP6_RHIMU
MFQRRVWSQSSLTNFIEDNPTLSYSRICNNLIPFENKNKQ